MQGNIEPHIKEIAQRENERSAGGYAVETLSKIVNPDFKSDVSDAPSVYRLDGVTRDADVILIVSNPDFPNFVIDTVETARAVATRLDADLGKYVLLPMSTGTYGKRSYAVYRRLRALSKNRAIGFGQITIIKGDVFNWLNEIGSRTQTRASSPPEIKERFLDPYNYVLNDRVFSSEIQTQTAAALAALETGAFKPTNVIQHGDFWQGNILLNRGWPLKGCQDGSFSIIDWGGANLKGYPYIDLLRFSLSIPRGKAVTKKRLIKYSRFCGFSGEEILYYVCAHIGHLGLNRHEFPLDRYVHSMEDLFAAVSRLNLGR